MFFGVEVLKGLNDRLNFTKVVPVEEIYATLKAAWVDANVFDTQNPEHMKVFWFIMWPVIYSVSS